MPFSRASRGLEKRTGSPSTSTSPFVGVSTPVRILMTVDFPAPFSPSRQNTSPERSLSDRLEIATTPTNRFVTFLSSTIGAAIFSGPPHGELAQPVVGEHCEQEQKADEEIG